MKIAGEVKQNNVIEVDSEKALLRLNTLSENSGCLFLVASNASFNLSIYE